MANFIIKEIIKEEDYNPLLLSSSAPFHQSFFYGEWQKKMGREVRRFKAEKNSETIACFQLIKYPLIFNKSYFYIPHGPVFKNHLEKYFLDEFYKTIKQLLKKEGAVFARFDFYPKTSSDFKHPGFIKTPPHSYHSSALQAKVDWHINLEKPSEQILAEMHPKTRYRIRLAEKRGVTTEIVRGKDMAKYFDVFYNLMRETAIRGKFALHPKKYYQSIFDDAAQNKAIDLVLTIYQGEILTTYIVVYYGDTAFYPLGASNRTHKELMPAYLGHWRAILEAQKRGCKFYNMGAFDAGQKIAHGDWAGITEFKTRFPGKTVEYSDFYDIVAEPFWYHLYNLRKKFQYKI